MRKLLITIVVAIASVVGLLAVTDKAEAQVRAPRPVRCASYCKEVYTDTEKCLLCNMSVNNVCRLVLVSCTPR